MRMFLVFVLGFIVGAVGLGMAFVSKASTVMVQEHRSASSIADTVARLKEVAEKDGWKFLGERKLHESIKQFAGIDVRPVHIVDLCQAAHAGKILAEDDARRVSVFMPCTIAVYEKTDGGTYVAATNASLLGRAFGGGVAEVMGGPVAEAQERFIQAAIAK